MPGSILVVDDSKVNRFVAEAKLREAGYDVKIAEDGQEALDILGVNSDAPAPPVDAVLLDIMMPGIDGMEVLARVRERWTSIQLPIIMTTAKDEREDILAAMEAGANDYVAKPLDLAILLARLTTHLQLKSSHEELKKAQRALLNAARIESVGLLAAGVAHEIRNPLGRISMAAAGLGHLMEKLPESERETGALIAETILESVDTADGIVQGLMRASEEQQLALVSVGLESVVQRAVDGMKEKIKAAGVSVVCEFSTEVPPVPLAGDEFYIALQEVLRNAVQAMKVGGGELRELRIWTEMTTLSGVGKNEGARIGTRPRDRDEVAALHVEDTGPGIGVEDIDRVADAFFTTKATGVGTGLGLTVARKIVELHKGVLRWENREKPPGGLRVSIFLKTGKGVRTNV